MNDDLFKQRLILENARANYHELSKMDDYPMMRTRARFIQVQLSELQGKDVEFLDYSVLDETGQKSSNEIKLRLESIIHRGDVEAADHAIVDLRAADHSIRQNALKILDKQIGGRKVDLSELNHGKGYSVDELLGKLEHAIQLNERKNLGFAAGLRFVPDKKDKGI